MSRNVETPHVFAMTPESLAAWCASRQLPEFRAKQVLEWVYAKGVVDPLKMSNLAAWERELLAREMRFLTGETIARQDASDGTTKLLIAWEEGDSVDSGTHIPTPRPLPPGGGEVKNPTPGSSPPGRGAEKKSNSFSLPQGGEKDSRKTTECVMIPADDRRTACISSQVGCPVGCKFCASGIGGLERNLSGGRIVEQVWRLRDMLRTHAMNKPGGDRRGTQEDFPRITNVVFMGMGEPLSNFANVLHAVKVITSLWGHAISARKVTISTVGLPAAIERLAAECDAPVTLALSLHAPTDELRRELIPWAQYSTIKELLASCQKWFNKTGREITLEYTLLRGVNDQPEHAAELARHAKTLRANVNLIRYNEVPGMPYGRPETEDVLAFQEVLRGRGVNVHIRASRGRDIAAACGQLKHEVSAGR